MKEKPFWELLKLKRLLNFFALLLVFFFITSVSAQPQNPSPGSTWTLWPRPGSSLIAVTYGAGTFVAVGEGGVILTSPNGVNWTERNSGTDKHLVGVTYGAGTFVAVGLNGTILTSPDGVNWTERNSGTDKHLLGDSHLGGVTYGAGTFVAVGKGIILTSP